MVVLLQEGEEQRRKVRPKHQRTQKKERKRRQGSHVSRKRPKSNWRERKLKERTAWPSSRRSLRLRQLRLEQIHTVPEFALLSVSIDPVFGLGHTLLLLSHDVRMHGLLDRKIVVLANAESQQMSILSHRSDLGHGSPVAPTLTNFLLSCYD